MNIEKNEILLIYNSNKLRDREALGYAKTLKDHKVKELDLQNGKITQTQIEEVIRRMGISLENLLDKNSKLYEENISGKKMDELSLLKLMEKNPEIIRTPISISEERAGFVDSSYEFIKEDMAQGDNKSNPDLEDRPKKE